MVQMACTALAEGLDFFFTGPQLSAVSSGSFLVRIHFLMTIRPSVSFAEDVLHCHRDLSPKLRSLPPAAVWNGQHCTFLRIDICQMDTQFTPSSSVQYQKLVKI
jgi:hypothetical protein